MSGRVMGEPYALGRELVYFEIRDCWIDFRGTLEISASAEFGFEVMLITASHHPNLSENGMGAAHRSIIRVDDKAWVANRAILYNCHIQHHATVGAGAVVQGVVIPPYTMAQGNPAMLVAVWVDGRWRRLSVPEQPKAFIP